MCAECEPESNERVATVRDEAARRVGLAMRSTMMTSGTYHDTARLWRNADKMNALSLQHPPDTVVTITSGRKLD